MLLVIVKAPHSLCFRGEIRKNIQSNLDSSNIDGSFTMANSNSFFSLCEILPFAQEQIIRESFLFYH